MLEGTVTITKAEYFRLKVTEAKMNLLEAGGVDNWEWYGESLHHGEVTLTKLQAEIEKELK